MTTKGLDSLETAMLAISDQGVDVSVCDPRVRALLIGTGVALGIHPDGGLPAGFSLLAKVAQDQELALLYWLLRTSVRKRDSLSFHRPPLFQGQVVFSHRNYRGMVLMNQRKQPWMGSRPSGKLCTGCMRGLPQTSSDTMLPAGWTWSTSWMLAHAVPLQAAQRWSWCSPPMTGRAITLSPV